MSENLKMQINWNWKIKNFVFDGDGLDEIFSEEEINLIAEKCNILHTCLISDFEKNEGKEMGVTLVYEYNKFLKLYQDGDIYKVKINGVYKDNGYNIERVCKHEDIGNAIIDLVIHSLHENGNINLGDLEKTTFVGKQHQAVVELMDPTLSQGV